MTSALDGPTRIGLPWVSFLAVTRIRTHPRAYEVLGALVQRHDLRGDALPDAHLAALAIEYGVGVCSADTDFALFTEIPWVNPLARALIAPRGR